jgi:hypothetical protein
MAADGIRCASFLVKQGADADRHIETKRVDFVRTSRILMRGPLSKTLFENSANNRIEIGA